MFKSRNSKIAGSILAIILVIIIAAGAIILRNSYVTSLSTDNQTIQNEQVFTLPVKIIDSSKNSFTFYMDANVEETLFSVLDRYDINHDDFKMEYKDYGAELGIFITNINDIQIDPNSQFWEFLVNGSQAGVGPSSYLVQKGDEIIYQITNYN